MDQKRILVVDDEPGITTLVKLNLEKTGRYEVETRNDPDAAVAAARDFKPDLILLDIVMPGKDGGELLAELQADDELKNTPVMFLTATLTDRGVDARQGTIKGFPFIAKPVEPKNLMKRIDQVLAQNK